MDLSFGAKTKGFNWWRGSDVKSVSVIVDIRGEGGSLKKKITPEVTRGVEIGEERKKKQK